MPRYAVKVPILASVWAFVEAEDEKSALRAALEVVGNQVEITGGHDVEPIDWEAHDRLMRGNVFFGHIGEARVEPDLTFEEADDA